MQVDPAGRGITIGGAERLHGFARGPGVVRAGFVEADAFEPGLAVERAAVADGQQIWSCARLAMNLQREAGPRLRAAERGGVDVERHGRHRERGAGGDRRAIEYRGP